MVSTKLSNKMLILAMTMKSLQFLGRASKFRISGTTALDVVEFVGLGELLDRPSDQFSLDFVDLLDCLRLI